MWKPFAFLPFELFLFQVMMIEESGVGWYGEHSWSLIKVNLLFILVHCRICGVPSEYISSLNNQLKCLARLMCQQLLLTQ